MKNILFILFLFCSLLFGRDYNNAKSIDEFFGSLTDIFEVDVHYRVNNDYITSSDSSFILSDLKKTMDALVCHLDTLPADSVTSFKKELSEITGFSISLKEIEKKMLSKQVIHYVVVDEKEFNSIKKTKRIPPVTETVVHKKIHEKAYEKLGSHLPSVYYVSSYTSLHDHGWINLCFYKCNKSIINETYLYLPWRASFEYENNYLISEEDKLHIRKQDKDHWEKEYHNNLHIGDRCEDFIKKVSKKDCYKVTKKARYDLQYIGIGVSLKDNKWIQTNDNESHASGFIRAIKDCYPLEKFQNLAKGNFSCRFKNIKVSIYGNRSTDKKLFFEINNVSILNEGDSKSLRGLQLDKFYTDDNSFKLNYDDSYIRIWNVKYQKGKVQSFQLSYKDERFYFHNANLLKY